MYSGNWNHNVKIKPSNSDGEMTIKTVGIYRLGDDRVDWEVGGGGISTGKI